MVTAIDNRQRSRADRGGRLNAGRHKARLRALLVLGTRPEAIKFVSLIKSMQKSSTFSVGLCLTGQHDEMVASVLSTFGIMADDNLRVMKTQQSLTSLTCEILRRLEPVLRKRRPDVVVVQRSTPSARARTQKCRSSPQRDRLSISENDSPLANASRVISV